MAFINKGYRGSTLVVEGVLGVWFDIERVSYQKKIFFILDVSVAALSVR